MLYIERFFSDCTLVFQDSDDYLLGLKNRLYEDFIKGDNVIEVQNIKRLDKGSLLAVCNVRIVPWKTTFRDVKIFQKGANRWIALPSREIVNPTTNEKYYFEMITFDTEEIKNRFRDQITAAIDEFLEKNSDMKPEDVIKFDDDLPF